MPYQHPNLKVLADFAGSHGVKSADPLRQSLPEARQAAACYQAIWNKGPQPAVSQQEVQLPHGTGQDVRLWIIRPLGVVGDLPVLVYFHGGGFAYNSLETHRVLMGRLAEQAGIAVLGVGYSLAPEVRFPGQLHQALAAVKWLESDGAAFGLDAGCWAMGGDSAGANLALACQLARRQAGLRLPLLSVLLYGMFSADLTSPSHQAFGSGAHGLPSDRVDWFWRQYVADFAQRDNPLAAPLRADLRGLPAQYVVGAGFDCLLDDSVRLADRLRLAGVETDLVIYDHVPHSFMQASAVLPAAAKAVRTTAALLQRRLAGCRAMAAE